MVERSGRHFRRAPRRGVGLPVEYRCGRSRLRHRGRICDVSLGGAFVEADHLPEVGTEVRLSVRAPTSWERIELRGQVRWVRPQAEGRGFGIRFVDLTPAEARALHALLQAASYEASGGGP